MPPAIPSPAVQTLTDDLLALARTGLAKTLTDQSTFPEVLTALHAQRFTGPVTLHLIHGVPTVIELPRPVQIRLKT